MENKAPRPRNKNHDQKIAIRKSRSENKYRDQIFAIKNHDQKYHYRENSKGTEESRSEKNSGIEENDISNEVTVENAIEKN